MREGDIMREREIGRECVLISKRARRQEPPIKTERNTISNKIDRLLISLT